MSPSVTVSDQHGISQKRSQIIIGGIPAPIGGVTTYLRRMLHRDSASIDLFIDFYPAQKEAIREDCQDKVLQLGGKAALIAWFWKNRAAQKGKEIFLNFSTPRALILTLFLPKFKGTHWCLLLHHGDLFVNSPFLMKIVRFALLRFDEIRSLSEQQTQFYSSQLLKNSPIVPHTNYCAPFDHVDDIEAAAAFSLIKSEYDKLLIMSGFPTVLYNLERGIEIVNKLNRRDCALCIFIYGKGDCRRRLKAFADQYPWLFVFDSKTERFFNTFLRQCDLLLRFTEIESFGISVWDASFWERRIVASDACRRPSEAHVVNLSKCSDEILKKLVEKVI